jgi:hypothetical protein
MGNSETHTKPLEVKNRNSYSLDTNTFSRYNNDKKIMPSNTGYRKLDKANSSL